jgi:hypothetical protein
MLLRNAKEIVSAEILVTFPKKMSLQGNLQYAEVSLSETQAQN